MDKLEAYLDQVCRGIGGGRELRQHLREELRQHLRDAAAEYKAAGLSEEEALKRALEHFGGPDEVRSELEATHGHRLLGVVIDKALDWKERTMKAKWLWLSWAHIAVIGVVVAEVLYITFCAMFLVPKFRMIDRDILDPALHQSEASWLYGCLNWLNFVDQHATLLLLGAIVLWGLFEWRVRSEHKSFIRLSAFGTAALTLLIGVVLTTGSMLILLFLGLPAPLAGATDRLVRQADRAIDSSLRNLDNNVPAMNWTLIQDNVDRANQAFELVASLVRQGPNQETPEEIAPKVDAARQALQEANDGLAVRDAKRVEAALTRFRASYDPVRQWNLDNKRQP